MKLFNRWICWSRRSILAILCSYGMTMRLMGESQKVDNSIGRKDLWLDPRFALTLVAKFGCKTIGKRLLGINDVVYNDDKADG